METRTALLDSAERLCRARGVDGFSYADMAADVGIRKASIHHHFAAKSDLASALVERYASAFLAALERISSSGKSAAARLRRYVSLYRRALGDGETMCLCVALAAGRDSLTPATLARLAAFHDANTAWLTQTFALANRDRSIKGVADPASEARACLALMEGAQLIAHAARRPKDFDEATQALTARMAREKKDENAD